jgi:peptidoglycan hydrolase CwlO-like protein
MEVLCGDVEASVTPSSEEVTTTIDSKKYILSKVSDILPKSLIGAKVFGTSFRMNNNIDIEHTIDENDVINEVYDATYYYGYIVKLKDYDAYIYVVKSVGGFLQNANIAFPSEGVYLSRMESGFDIQDSLTSIKYILKLDNKYLDKANADYDENNPDRTSYIENRPFYEGIETITIAEVTDRSTYISVGEDTPIAYTRLYKASDQDIPENFLIERTVVGTYYEAFSGTTTDITYSISVDDTFTSGNGGFYVKFNPSGVWSVVSGYVYVVSNYEKYSASTGLEFTSNGIYLSESYFEGAFVGTLTLNEISSNDVAIHKLDNKFLDLPNNEDFVELVDKVDTVEKIAKGATEAISFSNYEEMFNVLNSAPNDKYRIGQNFYILTSGVPDVWVRGIESSHTTANYIDDATVIQSLEGHTLHVGYYLLSDLDADEVDLNNYTTKKEFETLKEQVNTNQVTINTKVDNLDKKVDNLDESVGNLGSRVTAVEGDVDTLEGNIGSLDDRIAVVKGNVSSLGVDVGILDDRIATVNGNIDILNSRVTAVNKDVDSLEGSVGTFDSRVTTVENSVGTLEGDVSSLNSRVTTVEGNVGTLDEQVGTLDDKVGTLDEQVKTKQNKLINSNGYMVVPTLGANSNTVSYRKASGLADGNAVVIRNAVGNILLPTADKIPDNTDNSASVNKVLQMLAPINNIMGRRITDKYTIENGECGMYVVAGSSALSYTTDNASGNYEGDFHIFIIHNILSDNGTTTLNNYITHLYFKNGVANFVSGRITTPYVDIVEILAGASGCTITKMPMTNAAWK